MNQQKPYEIGNWLAALLFLVNGALAAFSQEWMGMVIWTMIGLTFAVMNGTDLTQPQSWRHPRTLLSLILLIIGAVAFIAQVIFDFQN